MKVVIELSDAEKQGIKDYLTSMSGGEKATDYDVKLHVFGIVQNTLYSPSEAVSDYINQYIPHNHPSPVIK